MDVYFVDHHAPALVDGDYTVMITQTVRQKQSDGTCKKLGRFRANRGFVVRGPRFRLTTQDVEAVYPPQGSAGAYDAVMPHVVLTRSTLPWERSPGSVDGADNSRMPSWLALILVGEHDDVHSSTVTLGALSDDPNADFPRRVSKNPTREQSFIENGELDTDVVRIIDIPVELLPQAHHLHLLAHVRRSAGGSAGDESARAVVVSHRRPTSHGPFTAHLVSVEGRYDKNAFVRDDKKARVRLVSLKQWSFTCRKESGGHFDALASDLKTGTLRLPGPTRNADAQHFLAQGAVPLPHLRRSQAAATALYHGPLVPWAGAKLTVGTGDMKRSAQHLVARHEAMEIEDVSYAAAWELGRLMMLHDRGAARQLYHWKCRCFQEACSSDLAKSDPRHATDHLPCQPAETVHPFPYAWFDRLMRLEGIPFCYLVPDESMLPRESIRIFEVERRWIEALVDGAFCVGSLSGSECAVHGAAMRGELHKRIPALTGFLLRSALVSGWPRLKVDVIRIREELPGQVSRDEGHISRRLSTDTVLHLFTGDPDAIDLAVPRELLHFEWSCKQAFPAKFSRSAELAAACAPVGHRLRIQLQRQ